MKGKLSFMWRATLALVLVLSLGVVMAVPVAADVSDVTVTNEPEAVSTAAKYTIEFTTEEDLLTSDTITITFPNDTTVPDGPGEPYDGNVKVNGTLCANGAVTGNASTRTVVITVSGVVDAGTVPVIFYSGAGVKNPSTVTDGWTLTVETSKEDTAVESAVYSTVLAPAVTSVDPPSALKSTTLDVVITGTGFTGATAVAFDVTDTTVTVSSFTVDSATQITADITTGTVTETTLGDVTVTTSGGTSTATDNFSVGVGPTGLVDVYNASLVYQGSYDTISAAVDAAPAGGTVVAHAATYEEVVVIAKGITLESRDGPATTIIDASAKAAADVRGAVSFIGVSGEPSRTLGGDGVGFTIIAPDATELLPGQYGVELWKDGAAMEHVTVQGNTIRGSTTTGSSSPQVGIHFWGNAPFTDITIKDNTLTTTFTVDMIPPAEMKRSFGIVTGANVTGLQGIFDGNTITDYSFGFRLKELDSTTTIKNNVVTGCDFDGIWVEGDGKITVYSNEVKNCGGNGLAIQGAPTIGVYKNSFHGNGNGVKVYSGVTASKVTINYNDIYDNTFPNTDLPAGSAAALMVYENYGIYNDGTGVLDAKYNFWSNPGDSPLDNSGPDSATYTTAQLLTYWEGTALGTGDIAGAVLNSTVDYEPWLTVPYATAYTDNIRFYAATYTLEEGWNTLSVPLTLKADADTLTEIVAMGDYIISDPADPDQNYVGGYSFDSGTWVAITGDYQFAPCKAVYVKMLAIADFPMAYSGQLGLPSQTLSAGWNLVGSAFGIDKVDGASLVSLGDYGVCGLDPSPGGKTYGQSEENLEAPDIESWKSVTNALDSLGTNASIVVSPSVPGQELAWVTTITAEAESSHYMIVGEGYWVFMTAPAITYAGFEVTPLYFVDPAPAE